MLSFVSVVFSETAFDKQSLLKLSLQLEFVTTKACVNFLTRGLNLRLPLEGWIQCDEVIYAKIGC